MQAIARNYRNFANELLKLPLACVSFLGLCRCASELFTHPAARGMNVIIKSFAMMQNETWIF